MIRNGPTMKQRSGVVSVLVVIAVVVLAAATSATFSTIVQSNRIRKSALIKSQAVAIENSAIQWLSAHKKPIDSEVQLDFTPAVKTDSKWTVTLKPIGSNRLEASTLIKNQDTVVARLKSEMTQATVKTTSNKNEETDKAED